MVVTTLNLNQSPLINDVYKSICFCFIIDFMFLMSDISTRLIRPDICRTFGSGVVQPFNGSSFYVRSSCPFTLTRFTHNRVECDVTTRRDDNGLLVRVEIIINKIRTVLHNGSIQVETKRSGLKPIATFILYFN